MKMKHTQTTIRMYIQEIQAMNTDLEHETKTST